MTDKERIEHDINVYANNFVDELIDFYQSCDCGTVSWEDIINMSSIQVEEHLAKAKDIDWEEE